MSSAGEDIEDLQKNIDKLRSALSSVDRDGDGLLNFKEFRKGLEEIGISLKDDEITKTSRKMPKSIQETAQASHIESGLLPAHMDSRAVCKKRVEHGIAHVDRIRNVDGVLTTAEKEKLTRRMNMEPASVARQLINFEDFPAEEINEKKATPADRIGSMRRAFPQRREDQKNLLHIQENPSTARRSKWSKLDVQLRNAIKANLPELKKAFSADANGKQEKHLKPEEFKETLHRIGVSVGDSDFEKILPKLKIDRGGITLQKLIEVFVDHKGETIEMRDKHKQDRVSYVLMQNDPLLLKKLCQTVVQLDESEFKQAITEVDAILSESDAQAIFRKASVDGKVTREDIESSLKHLSEYFDPEKAQSHLGFGTGSKLRKAQGPSSKFKGSWGTDDPSVQSLYSKIAESGIGNRFRLRQIFRKYDMDRSGSISCSELITALKTHNVPLSKAECSFLEQIADHEGRGLVAYNELISAIETSSRQRAHVGREVSTERSFSASSVHSQSSFRSMRSNASVRSTSSFAGSSRDRGDWVNDKNLQAEARRAARTASSEGQSARGSQGTSSSGVQTRILHFATPPPAFGSQP
ncbi:hypothetical protein GUITHDRAFT_106791 [Guillardia theta CCMP2712]|uniref:EF-hand domain-containing protein n=1 Tax=Guillardia theta (strain CCMP2712) TaxID=905079 RepID=L1JFQ5_GUITC|nr:hypothetical protein GUITHDRAFT_106791 [Guillardia theta CCMP2712]EKX47343.1 hypothetical protein GUITHDRAFT_106791 [Guillardia theta CCMP2712]|eukprot:XP_005834323.1 hypothetical protein GUITHDRAFT_106791 [Guillardia theta CCMP2712]